MTTTASQLNVADNVRPFLHGDFRRVLAWYRHLALNGALPAFDVKGFMAFPDLANRMLVADKLPNPTASKEDTEEDSDENGKENRDERTDASNRPSSYRWRYAGSRLCETWGGEWTTRSVDETHGEKAAETLRSVFDEILKTGRAYYWRQPLNGAKDTNPFLCLEQMVVPFCDRNGVARHVVGVARVRRINPSAKKMDGMFI